MQNKNLDVVLFDEAVHLCNAGYPQNETEYVYSYWLSYDHLVNRDELKSPFWVAAPTKADAIYWSLKNIPIEKQNKFQTHTSSCGPC